VSINFRYTDFLYPDVLRTVVYGGPHVSSMAFL
jgi:hypothetical protein